MDSLFKPLRPADNKYTEQAFIFVFQHTRLLCKKHDDSYRMPTISDIDVDKSKLFFIGELADMSSYCIAVDENYPLVEGYDFVELRALLLSLTEAQFSAANRAFQLLEWLKNHKFCGRCAHPLHIDARGETALVCAACHFSVYPRINPCVIVVVMQGDKILLARSKRFKKPMYSALAGFVEAGESAEAAVHREVKEEVGVAIKNIRYIASQAWPFPNNLMMAYLAEYESGDIVVQEEEILDAQFFSYDDLPLIPEHGTIARMLIEAYRKEITVN
jgi:NAD+ diphosphatase